MLRFSSVFSKTLKKIAFLVVLKPTFQECFREAEHNWRQRNAKTAEMNSVDFFKTQQLLADHSSQIHDNL